MRKWLNREVPMTDNVIQMPSARWVDQLVDRGYLDPARRRSAAAIKAATDQIRAKPKRLLRQIKPDDEGPKTA